MKRKYMKSPLIIITLLIFAVGCGPNGAEEEQQSQKLTPVSTTKLQTTSFHHYIQVQGDVESDNTIMITPKVSATVDNILVRTGDTVQKGDILAKLDGEITKSQIQEVQTQLELAKTLFERQQNLRDQNIGSEVEYLQAKTQFESANNQLATLKEQYENYTIRATISGTVNMVDLKVGESVGPSSPVFQLANSDGLKVTTSVSEAYITRIEQTDSVEITFPSLNTTIRKQLDVVSKVINPSNRTFDIEIYIPNTDDIIRPNMMAKVKINDITLHDQIVIPVNTVQMANNNRYVFVAAETNQGWVARNREVSISHNYNNDLVVDQGLQPGDRLITAGYNDLSDGTPISIQDN